MLLQMVENECFRRYAGDSQVSHPSSIVVSNFFLQGKIKNNDKYFRV